MTSSSEYQRSKKIRPSPCPCAGRMAGHDVFQPEGSRTAISVVCAHQLVGAVTVERHHDLLTSKLAVDQPYRVRRMNIDVVGILEDVLKVRERVVLSYRDE